jgi:transposase
VACGRWCQASVTAQQTTGYGPRLSALMAELAGTYGNGRRMVQTFCCSVLGVPISLGAIQQVIDRVSQAIDPHYTLIATYPGKEWGKVGDGRHQTTRYGETVADERRRQSLEKHVT